MTINKIYLKMLLNLAFLKTICLFSRNFCRSFVYIYKNSHCCSCCLRNTDLFDLYRKKKFFFNLFCWKKMALICTRTLNSWRSLPASVTVSKNVQPSDNFREISWKKWKKKAQIFPCYSISRKISWNWFHEKSV